MEEKIFLLIFASWVLLAAGLLIEIFLFIRRKGMSLSTKLLIFSGLLFTSITLLRFATSLYIDESLTLGLLTEGIISELGDNAVCLDTWEHFLRSMVQSLRTFALDEDYTVFSVAAESMKENVLSAHFLLPVIYRVSAALASVLAPVAGGAIIFDILTRVFPWLKLKTMPLWCEFYVFSELNDSSLALAQSIKEDFKNSRKIRGKHQEASQSGATLQEDLEIVFPCDKQDKKKCSKREKPLAKKKKRPVIVFTDVYVDREDESVSERISSAKAMGAICLTDDIVHINVRGFIRRMFSSKVNLLLMDEKEEINMHTLSMLAEDKKGEKLLDACVYMFSSKASANDLVRGVNIKLRNKYGDDNRLPVIRVIDGYKNLVYNLLTQVPLYEPLVGRTLKEGEKEKNLNVTVIGSGNIGMQMFLATYWMGQMLDVNLFINVVSQESEEDFRNRLNLINADILKSESSQADSQLLKIYCNSLEQAKPYFTFRYTQADVMRGNLYDALSTRFKGEKFALCDSDYFVVAIGSDENNIFVANKIRQLVGRSLLTDRTNRRAVINYVVFDKDICETLNTSQDNPKIYMNAFGNFTDVYTYENVFMSKTYGTAVELNNLYISRAGEDKAYGKKEMAKFVDDEYGYWSSIARGLHIPYKYFSAGAVTKSMIFDKADCVTEDSEVFNNYLRRICLELTSKTGELPSEKEREALYYRLIWLEHRRWNSFIRTGGFTAPDKTQLDAYAFKSGNKTKELSLRLHPCLVECDDKAPKIPAVKLRSADISDHASVDLSCVKAQNYDMLDAVSLYLHTLAKDRANSRGCIYKAYDSPYELCPESKSLKIQ